MAASPGHKIEIEPYPGRVRVTFAGETVADSTRALQLHETGLPTVLYVPKEDADAALLERTAHGSHCPFKGDASYFSIRVGDRVSENAVWTYEQPIEAAAQIKDHLAFYRKRVDSVEEL